MPLHGKIPGSKHIPELREDLENLLSPGDAKRRVSKSEDLDVGVSTCPDVQVPDVLMEDANLPCECWVHINGWINLTSFEVQHGSIRRTQVRCNLVFCEDDEWSDETGTNRVRHTMGRHQHIIIQLRQKT